MKGPYIVGITGGSASGKTLFLNSLLDLFSQDQVCLISQDNYYKPREQQPVDEQGVRNFDTPESILAEEYARDITLLKNNHQVKRCEYTFNNPSIHPVELTFYPAPIIVVEGLFVFHYPQVAQLLDLKIFIDAEEHVMLKRRIIRDKIERGYDLEDVLYRFEKHVVPMYKRYIKPCRDEADLVIPSHSHFGKAREIIGHFLKSKIDE